MTDNCPQCREYLLVIRNATAKGDEEQAQAFRDLLKEHEQEHEQEHELYRLLWPGVEVRDERSQIVSG